jgi:hypothetical protein
MSKKKVEFNAHKVVKKETEVRFTTKDGTKVDFEARKPTQGACPCQVHGQ